MKRLYFPKDAYYENPAIPLYSAGRVYDIEEKMVMRWIKRGAVEVVKGGPGFGQASSKPNDQTGKPIEKPKVEVKKDPVPDLPVQAEQLPDNPPVSDPVPDLPEVKEEPKEKKLPKKK